MDKVEQEAWSPGCINIDIDDLYRNDYPCVIELYWRHEGRPLKAVGLCGSEIAETSCEIADNAIDKMMEE